MENNIVVFSKIFNLGKRENVTTLYKLHLSIAMPVTVELEC